MKQNPFITESTQQKKGYVNGQFAAIYFDRKTYIPITDSRIVNQTADGRLFVCSTIPGETPAELPLLPTDEIGIWRDEPMG